MRDKTEQIEVDIEEIVFREDLYPRITGDRETVEKYAQSLELLPPIEINQHYELIDGWHRWQAHKLAEAETIQAYITNTASEAEFLELAIERNAKHGLQLSMQDKRTMANRIYVNVPPKQQAEKKKELQRLLAVDMATIHRWLETWDKETERQQKQQVFDLWLACYTQQEIADKTEILQRTVSNYLQEFSDFSKISQLRENAKNAENRANFNDGVDQDGEPYWRPPLYTNWAFTKLSNEVSHYGNTEQRIVENLLYLYTEPFDIVIDPFGGGGSTIDVCKKRFRRYLVSDRKPTDKRDDIRLHDVADGPMRTDWQNVRLVYLDPPYWRQAENKYSADAEDLANMELDEFHKSLAKTIKSYASKMKQGYIALIIASTQYPNENKETINHMHEMVKTIKLKEVKCFGVPYSTEQYNGNQVLWAKENKETLETNRQMIVWQV